MRNKFIYIDTRFVNGASHCWYCNHYFDFTKACIMSSPISNSHLNFYEAFFSLKNSNNLVNVTSLLHLLSLMPWNCLFKFFLLFSLFYQFFSFIYILISLFYALFICCSLFSFSILLHLNFIKCCNQNFLRVFLIN